MKIRGRQIEVRMWLVLFAFCVHVSMFAQGYSVDWFKVAGGGGTSTNGQFIVSGTIGQHDAGPTMTNGQFSLTGGFWVLPTVVQVEGAPTLKIDRKSTRLNSSH